MHPFLLYASGAQSEKAATSLAQVNIIVTDMKGKPSKVAKGYGVSSPIADNSTEEGRQQNRRTEVKVL